MQIPHRFLVFAATVAAIASCRHAPGPRRARPAPASAIAADTEIARSVARSVCTPVSRGPVPALEGPTARVLTPPRLAGLASAASARSGAERESLAEIHRLLAAAYIRGTTAEAEDTIRHVLDTPVGSNDRSTRLGALLETLGSTPEPADRAALLEASKPALDLLASTSASALAVTLTAARDAGVRLASLREPSLGGSVDPWAVRLLGASGALYLGLAGDAAAATTGSRAVSSADLPRVLRARESQPEDPRLADAIAALGADIGLTLPPGADPAASYARAEAVCSDPLLPCGPAVVSIALSRLAADPAWLAEQGLGHPGTRVARSTLRLLALVRRDAALVSAAAETQRAVSGEAVLDPLARRLSEAYGTTLDHGLATLVAAQAGPPACAAARLDAVLAAAALEQRLVSAAGPRWWQTGPGRELLRRIASGAYPDGLDEAAGAPGARESSLVRSLAAALVGAELSENPE